MTKQIDHTANLHRAQKRFTQMAKSLVDMIMEQDERRQAPLLASIIVTLGDEYLLRHALVQTGRRR
jgi:hypothetical protein